MNKNYIDRNFFRNVRRQQKFEQEVIIGNYNIYDYVHDVLIDAEVCDGTLDDSPADIYVPYSVVNGKRYIKDFDSIDIQYIVHYVLTQECSYSIDNFVSRKNWSKRTLQEFYLPSGYTSSSSDRYSLKDQILAAANEVTEVPTGLTASITVANDIIILLGNSEEVCSSCAGVLTIRDTDATGMVVYTEVYTCDSNGDINDTNDEPFDIGGLGDGEYYLEWFFTSCGDSITTSTTYSYYTSFIEDQTLDTDVNTDLVVDLTLNGSICTSPTFRIDSVTNGSTDSSSNSSGSFTFSPTADTSGTAIIEATLLCNGTEVDTATITITINAEEVSIQSIIPTSGSTDVGTDTDLVLVYPASSVLTTSTGTFSLATTAAPTVAVDTVVSTDADVVISGNTVTISNLTFGTSTEYTFFIDADFVQNDVGDASTAQNAGEFTFTTGSSGNAAPVADLVLNTAYPLTGSSVSFDASGSTDDTAVVQYDYDFGDSNTSTNAGSSTSHTYTSSGSYTAEVTVYDQEGLSDTDTVAVTVNDPLSASFTRTQDNLEVTFTDASDSGTQTITSWNWDFGDTNSTTGQGPHTHTYAAAGDYTVELTIASANDSSSFSTTITVTEASSSNYECVDWTVDQLTINSNCDVNTNSSTTTGWNNNGAYTTSAYSDTDSDMGLRYTHQAGRYSVGFSNDLNKSYYYQQSFEYGLYVSGTTANPIMNNVWDGNTDWTINSGDEVVISKSGTDVTFSIGGVVQATLTYIPPVTEDVYGKVSVRNTNTDIDALELIGAASNTSPTADFTFSTDGLDATFTDTSSQGSATINQWSWDFGDSSGTSTDEDPTYTYSTDGTYTVTLTVTDQLGETDTTTEEVTVAAITGPTANFNAAISGLTVAFTDTSTEGSGTIDTWSWDLGDSTMSPNQNLNHTYPADGTYTVELTVTDDNLLSDTYSFDVTVAATTDDIDLLIERWSEGNRDENQGDLPSASVSTLIAEQQTDGTFSSLGSLPTSSSAASINYLWDWLYYVRKLSVDYKYGTYSGTAGEASTRVAVWRAIKGMSDNINTLAFYSRGTWTPQGWWVPREFSRVLCTMSDAYGTYSSETVDSVAVSTFLPILVDEVLGATSMIKNDDFSGWHDISMTGSIDNVRGNNQIARQSQMQGVAAFATKHNGGDTTGLTLIKTKIENNFIIGAGLDYVEEEDEYSGWVGIGPGGAYAAHNSASGIQDQLCNYGRVTLRNHGDYVERSRGTAYEHDSTIYGYIVDLCEQIAKAFIRGKNSVISEGREGLRVANGGADYGTFGSGAVAFVIQKYIDYANLTTDQLNDLTTYETSIRRAAVLPNYNSTNYMWTTGTSIFIGGDTGSEYSSRWRLGKARDVDNGIAGVSHVEQAIGATPNLFLTEGSWYGMGHDVNEDNNSEAFNQFVSMIGAYPFECPHGTTNWQNPDDYSYRLTANSNNTPDNNSLAGGVAYNDEYVISGYNKDRVNTLSKVTCYSTKIGIERADNIGYVFHLEAGINPKNSFSGDIVTNSVDPFDRDIIYNFTGTQATRTAGTYGTNTYSSPDKPYVWFEAVPSHATYNYGKGTLWLDVGTLNVTFSQETRTNDYLRGGMGGSVTSESVVMSDVHGSTPSDASSVFVDMFRVEASDMESARTNIDDQFYITNTSDVQGVVDIDNDTAHYMIWNASGATVPIEMSSSTTTVSSVTVDKPCALTIVKSGSDFIVTYADADWQVQSTQKSLNIEIDTATASAADYDFATITLVDRGTLYPAGTYYGGGQTTINIS